MNLKDLACVAAGFACSLPALSQPMDMPAQRLAAQREAMGKFAALDGVWRGKASTTLPDGKQHEITQTERVGSFLDGSIKLVEGRGYEADGSVGFNALGVISYNPATRAYSMHSNAQGYSGNFIVTPLANGFSWEIPAGPMTIKYTATIKDGTWHEIGERLVPGQQPVRMFEMTLKRIGSTSWPAGDAVPAK